MKFNKIAIQTNFYFSQLKVGEIHVGCKISQIILQIDLTNTIEQICIGI